MQSRPVNQRLARAVGANGVAAPAAGVLAGFRRSMLFAYGGRCAVTRVQLRLVDAAHIFRHIGS